MTKSGHWSKGKYSNIINKNIKYWNMVYYKWTYRPKIKFVENTEILYRLTQPLTNIA